MKANLIYGQEATLETLIALNEKMGIEFVVEDGGVTDVLVG